MENLEGRVNQKVCFICSLGHSGSTLLGLILGSHSDCFYCGEAVNTQLMLEESQPLRVKACRTCGMNCPVWKDLPTGNFDRLYEYLSIKTQKQTIVDSSKKINWIEKQLEYLAASNSQPFLIFLQRDGRAVLNSWRRKHPDKDVRKIIERWVATVQSIYKFYEKFSGNKIEIHYEHLATNPASEVAKICEFLGMEYQSEMLNFYQHEHHAIRGNDGTHSLVAKTQNQIAESSLANVPDGKNDYYKDREQAIKLDLRWQTELAPEHLRLFEAMAGQENAAMKWEG